MYYVYVIYSQIKQGYYVGQTEDVAARILRHNNGYESYTSKYMPWELAISIHKETRSEAVQLERKLNPNSALDAESTKFLVVAKICLGLTSTKSKIFVDPKGEIRISGFWVKELDEEEIGSVYI